MFNIIDINKQMEKSNENVKRSEEEMPGNGICYQNFASGLLCVGMHFELSFWPSFPLWIGCRDLALPVTRDLISV